MFNILASLLILLNLNIFRLYSQHCAFDYAYLIGVRPFDKDSTRIVKGLRITLVNEFQQPVGIKNGAVLKQNHISDYRRLGKTVEHEDMQYSFAPNDYVAISNSSFAKSSNLFIKVEDQRKTNKVFQTQIIPVSTLNFIHLCGYNPKYNKEKFKRYHPVWVDLNNPQNVAHYKIYELQHFVFRVDENPIFKRKNKDENSRYVRLEIFTRGNNLLIHDQYFRWDGPSHIEKSLQITDFNFDGQLDFSVLDKNKRQFFLFEPRELKFKQDSLLSSFHKVELDIDNKCLIGHTNPVTCEVLEFDMEHLEYRFSGSALGQVEVSKILRSTLSNRSSKQFVDSMLYINGKLELRIIEGKASMRSVSAGGFRFERELQTYHLAETTEKKPPGWKPTLTAVAIYRIYRIVDNKEIFNNSGEHYLNYQGGEIKDPMVKDVDFDGSPDLIVPISGSANQNRYYGYNTQENKFKELAISYLFELIIDEMNRKAIGYRFEYQGSSPYPTAKIHYILQGPGLPVVREQREMLPKAERNPPSPNLVLFSKIERQFLVELKLLDAAEIQQLDSRAGYTHKVSIVNQMDKNQAVSFYLKATLSPSPQELERAMSIQFLNFDAFPDLIIESGVLGEGKQIWLSCLKEGSWSCYLDEHLSKSSSYRIDLKNEVIYASYSNENYRVYYEAHFLFEPFFILTTQVKTNPQNATRAIFSNSCGHFVSKKASLVDPITDINEP